MSDELNTWLSKELELRGWSHRELARRAGLSQTAISSTLSGDRKAGCDFCIKVAQALGESPEKVLRLAGILPSLPVNEDSTIHEITELLKNLSAENRQDILQYVKFRYQQERDDE